MGLERSDPVGARQHVADAVPDLTGLQRSYREDVAPSAAMVSSWAASTSAVLAAFQVIGGRTGAALFWAALVVVQLLVHRWTAKNPFSTQLDEQGLTVRRPGRTRRIAWADVAALHPGGRWDAARTTTTHDGVTTQLHGMPREAVEQLSEALAAARSGSAPAGAPVASTTERTRPAASRPAGLAGVDRRSWRTFVWFIAGMAAAQLAQLAPSVLPREGRTTVGEVALLVVALVCFGVAGWSFLRNLSRSGGATGTQDPPR